MSIKLGVVMDPIENITIKKDSTFAMLLEAEQRSWTLFYMEQADLYFSGDTVYGRVRELSVADDPKHWFTLGEAKHIPLRELNIILMRKDPPFDMEYIYSTYLLELAERDGVLVANKPQALRDANEKMVTTWFPNCCPETLVTRDMDLLHDFFDTHKNVVYKPLDGMGGKDVFHVQKATHNLNVIIESLTDNGKHCIIAQRFIPEIKEGDKRILLFNGEAFPYAITRIPAEGETRGNLAVGAKAHGIELTERDHWICQQIGPTMRDMGLWFVGIDVIGDYLTEINVTSPTCIREIDATFNVNASAKLMDCLEQQL